jgi:hypothetical protein
MAAAVTPPQPPQEKKSSPFSSYGADWPLGGYAVLLASYAALFGIPLLAAEERRLPSDLRIRDLLLLGIATHKLTRIATRDWVTAPLRAPFTRFKENVGAGEVAEQARGQGLQRAVGDLLTCRWCFAPWVAGALMAGLTLRPKKTRIVAGAFAAVAISDFLQFAYDAARKLKGK